MKKLFLNLCTTIIAASFIISCNTSGNSSVTNPSKNSDPELKLTKLIICKQDAIKGSLTVENNKKEITASDITAIFDYGTQKGKPIKVIVSNGILSDIKENNVNISVHAKPGEHKKWDMNIKVTRKPATQEPKISVKNIKAKFGINDWGSFYYGEFSDLSFDEKTKKYTIKKPADKEVIAFQIDVNTEIKNTSDIKVKLFQGTLKDGIVNYDVEKTKMPTAGTFADNTLTFNLDENNCKDLSVRDFYKAEFFVGDNKNTEIFIELK